MSYYNETDAPLRTVLAALNREQGWNLTVQELNQYEAALQPYITSSCSEAILRDMCKHYHRDHRLVAVLIDQERFGHAEAWTEWIARAAQILTHNGLSWSSDHAVERDDLVQIAMAELARSLKRYRYRSSFNTWAHTVVQQSVRRYLRDSQAKKRAQRPGSLEDADEVELTVGEAEHPEVCATAAALQELITEALDAAPDTRLRRIFHLWAIKDQTTEEIATQFHLHPSRIRALLLQARRLLMAYRPISEWNTGGIDCVHPPQSG